MKKSCLSLMILMIMIPGLMTGQIFNDAMRVVKQPSPVSEGDAVKGIREALIQGTGKSVELVSRVDGYLKNPEISIPFPPQAKNIETQLRTIGMGQQIDDLVIALNRAAEDAARQAQPIFMDAILGMTVTDAINIVQGQDDAATQYLSRTTSEQLRQEFAPVIKTSLDKVYATVLWARIINAYNNIPMVSRQNPDLTAYVTQKAIQGLFTMIAKEEAMIRKNPSARTTEILQKVFGR